MDKSADLNKFAFGKPSEKSSCFLKAHSDKNSYFGIFEMFMWHFLKMKDIY